MPSPALPRALQPRNSTLGEVTSSAMKEAQPLSTYSVMDLANWLAMIPFGCPCLANVSPAFPNQRRTPPTRIESGNLCYVRIPSHPAFPLLSLPASRDDAWSLICITLYPFHHQIEARRIVIFELAHVRVVCLDTSSLNILDRRGRRVFVDNLDQR